jgi:hypothetical protein
MFNGINKLTILPDSYWQQALEIYGKRTAR